MAERVGVRGGLNGMTFVFAGPHEVAQGVEIGLFTFVERTTGEQPVDDPLCFGKVLVGLDRSQGKVEYKLYTGVSAFAFQTELSRHRPTPCFFRFTDSAADFLGGLGGSDSQQPQSAFHFPRSYLVCVVHFRMTTLWFGYGCC